jgi:hypothetical protein
MKSIAIPGKVTDITALYARGKFTSEGFLEVVGRGLLRLLFIGHGGRTPFRKKAELDPRRGDSIEYS